MSQLLIILGSITSLLGIYNDLKALWASKLTPQQKKELAAKEDPLFKSDAWKWSGLK